MVMKHYYLWCPKDSIDWHRPVSEITLSRPSRIILTRYGRYMFRTVTDWDMASCLPNRIFFFCWIRYSFFRRPLQLIWTITNIYHDHYPSKKCRTGRRCTYRCRYNCFTAQCSTLYYLEVHYLHKIRGKSRTSHERTVTVSCFQQWFFRGVLPLSAVGSKV